MRPKKAPKGPTGADLRADIGAIGAAQRPDQRRLCAIGTMGTIGANSDDSALGTISRSKSYPPLSAKIISTNQISPNSKFSISSVPPLRWSKNRKCAVNEPLAFPAFSETAFNLAFAEITGNTGHFIQHQVVRTLICGRPSPAGGPFGPRAISCAKVTFGHPRSRERGAA